MVFARVCVCLQHHSPCGRTDELASRSDRQGEQGGADSSIERRQAWREEELQLARSFRRHSCSDREGREQWAQNFACKHEMDFVAVSFVQTAEDVRLVRRTLDEAGGNHIQIISKIENQAGLENYDEILRETDGVMVARGDLGMEIPPEKVKKRGKMADDEEGDRGMHGEYDIFVMPNMGFGDDGGVANASRTSALPRMMEKRGYSSFLLFVCCKL